SLGRGAGAPRRLDRAGHVYLARRGGPARLAAPRLGAARCARAHALPRRLRLGERDARPARSDPLHRAGRDPRRPHGHAAERPLRRAPRGDRMKLLELRGLSMAFGGLRVVSELDMHVDEGEVVSVIGPNGAGKTTLFNLITGIYDPTAG